MSPASAPPELVLHPRHGPGLDIGLGRLEDASLAMPGTPDEVVEVLTRGAAGLITFDWESRYLTPGLRWVQAISAGVDQFPVGELSNAGVVLTSATGIHTPAVAEHAMALLLALVRGIGPATRRATRHEWQIGWGTEVRDLTITILGMGSIGHEIARLLQPYGARLIGVRRHPEPSDLAEMVGPDRLHWACEVSDVLICALPETSDTVGLVGEAELGALGAGWLVNVGRGSSVDQDALIHSLEEGELRGAAIDVTSPEPLPPQSPLWDIEDLIITPHMAWASDHLTPRLVDLIAENIAAFRGEREWVNRIN